MNLPNKNTALRLCFLAALLSTAASAQDAGQASEARALRADISAIRLDGAIDLKIKQGNSPGIIVRGDKARFERTLTEQEDNTLHIRRKGRWFINWLRSWIYDEGPVTVEVTLPALQKLAVQGGNGVSVAGFTGEQMQLDVNGSGDVDVNSQYKKINASINGSGNIRFTGCAGEEVKLLVTGSGTITASGQSRFLIATMTGSGSLETRQLLADTAKVSITGSGNANIFASQAVDIALTGSSNVHVFGKPPRHQVSSVGANDVAFD